MNDRRAWLRDGARWLGVILFGGAIAALVARKPNPAAGACDRDRVCRRCPAVGGCVQPEAMSWRAVAGSQEGA
jgi:hypothetical protein